MSHALEWTLASLREGFATAFTSVPLLNARFIPVKSILYHVLAPAVRTSYTVHPNPRIQKGCTVYLPYSSTINFAVPSTKRFKKSC